MPMPAIKTFPYTNGLFVAIAGNLEAVEATRKQARRTLEQLQIKQESIKTIDKTLS
jgi:hypothetical protein